MKSNLFKKITAATLLIWTFSSVSVFAASVPITSHKQINSKWNMYYNASSWVDTSPYHYANIRLFDNTGKMLKESGRVFGYGKVNISTANVGQYSSASKLSTNIYYGWN